MKVVSSPSQALRTGLAEKRESQPRVAVLDSFRPSPLGPTHGEIVDAVLQQDGGLDDADIQLFHSDSKEPFSVDRLAETPVDEMSQSIKAYVRGTAESFLDSISDNLQAVLSDFPSIEAVNVSQSQSAFGIAKPILGRVAQDAEFEERVRESLQVPSRLPVTDLVTALLSYTETVLAETRTDSHSWARYRELVGCLEKRGVAEFVAAGNLGREAEHFRNLGVNPKDTTFRSILVQPGVFVVGALDQEGRPADFNSPAAGINIFDQGTADLSLHSRGRVSAVGTSVATPRSVVGYLRRRGHKPLGNQTLHSQSLKFERS